MSRNNAENAHTNWISVSLNYTEMFYLHTICTQLYAISDLFKSHI